MNAQDDRAMFELQLELHTLATGRRPNITADDILDLHELLAVHQGGRLAIVASWLESKDVPGTYEGHYEPVAIQGDLAVANGRSRYFTDASKAKLAREYDNLFLIRFDDHGRCRSIREWYMGRRGQKEPV
jgi:hypothetical protein